MENNSKSIETMSIKETFSGLEKKVNSFMADYIKETLIGKEKPLKIVLDTPIVGSSVPCFYNVSEGYKSAYIKEICASIENNNRLWISVIVNEKYIEENAEHPTDKVWFNSLLIDDKAMIASDIEDGNFFLVDEDFKNNVYKVVSDSGYVYNEGDYITTTLLARDFLEGCNEKEDADLMGHVYSLLYNNKGEELVKFICEAWDGLFLEKVY